MGTFNNSRKAEELLSFFESEKKVFEKLLGYDKTKKLSNALCEIHDAFVAYDTANFKGELPE